MTKRIKWIGIALACLAILFALGAGLFAWRYQKIVDRFSELADEHCLTINPLIIERKTTTRDFLQLVSDPQAFASADKYDDLTRNYYEVSSKYIDGENAWMAKQKQITGSLEFRILVPAQVQKAAVLQLAVYKADRDGSVAMMNVLNSFFSGREPEMRDFKKIADSKNNQDKYWDEYDKLFRKNSNNRDPRLFFFSPPPSKCPAENFDFPNIFEFPAKPLHDPGDIWPLG